MFYFIYLTAPSKLGQIELANALIVQRMLQWPESHAPTRATVLIAVRRTDCICPHSLLLDKTPSRNDTVIYAKMSHIQGS